MSGEREGRGVLSFSVPCLVSPSHDQAWGGRWGRPGIPQSGLEEASPPCPQARLVLLPQLHCLLEVPAPRGRRQCGITWGFPGCILVSHHTELEDGTEGLTQICGQLG